MAQFFFKKPTAGDASSAIGTQKASLDPRRQHMLDKYNIDLKQKTISPTGYKNIAQTQWVDTLNSDTLPVVLSNLPCTRARSPINSISLDLQRFDCSESCIMISDWHYSGPSIAFSW